MKPGGNVRRLAACSAPLALILLGAAAVSGRAAPRATIQGAPSLTIGSVVPAAPCGSVTLPLTIAAADHAISSLAFAVDYSARALALDPTDADADGQPDAIRFHLSGAFSTVVTPRAAQDGVGQLDFAVFDPAPPLERLPDGVLVDLTLLVRPGLRTDGNIAVRFGTAPPPSFGDTSGASVAGAAVDGMVRLGASLGSCLMLPELPVGR
jgi:hypothetical protein